MSPGGTTKAGASWTNKEAGGTRGNQLGQREGTALVKGDICEFGSPGSMAADKKVVKDRYLGANHANNAKEQVWGMYILYGTRKQGCKTVQ